MLINIIAFLMLSNCSNYQSCQNDFDQRIIDSLKKYDYTLISIGDTNYKHFKDSILQNQPIKNPYFTRLDAYSLTGYVNTINPEILKLKPKYQELESRDKLTFIKNVIHVNNHYFKENILFFNKAINDLKPDSERDLLLLQIIKLYCNTYNNLTLQPYKNLLDKADKIDFPVQDFLTKLIGIEREQKFAYELLLFLSNRKDWQSTDNYINYWVLFETKDSIQNGNFKNFFRNQLLTLGYQDNPWNGYGSFLPKWFSVSEICEICKTKREEQKTYHYTFYNQLRDVLSIELYVSNAGFYQVKYFPIESTLEIIDIIPVIDQKLMLCYFLLNLRTDLTDSQKGKIKDIIYSFKGIISESNSSSLLIQTLRSLDKAITFKSIVNDFPNLYSNWNPKNYLEILYQNSKYSWNDFLNRANENNTFGFNLNSVDEYYLGAYLADNYAFQLCNNIAKETIFEVNSINVSLNDEYGDWPIDYSYIIKSNFKKTFDKHIKGDIDYFYSYKHLPNNKTLYSIYFKMSNKLHSLTYVDSTGLPNNEAITLLINKALIDSGIAHRFYNYTNEGYNLVLVEPEKYEELINKLK